MRTCPNIGQACHVVGNVQYHTHQWDGCLCRTTNILATRLSVKPHTGTFNSIVEYIGVQRVPRNFLPCVKRVLPTLRQPSRHAATVNQFFHQLNLLFHGIFCSSMLNGDAL